MVSRTQRADVLVLRVFMRVDRCGPRLSGGDCIPPDELTEEQMYIPDCIGQDAPRSWIGDGNCDNGVRAHAEHWIDFNCEEHQLDGGNRIQ